MTAPDYCEICGRVDHHLVHGVCPVCRPRCSWYALGNVGLMLRLLTEDSLERAKRHLLRKHMSTERTAFVLAVRSLPDPAALDVLSQEERAIIYIALARALEGTLQRLPLAPSPEQLISGCRRDV